MRKILSFEELQVGDILQTRCNIHTYIGGPLQYNQGARLQITKMYAASIQAGPEGGKEVGHTFVGTRSLNDLYFVERPSETLQPLQTTAGKTAKPKQKNKHK